MTPVCLSATVTCTVETAAITACTCVSQSRPGCPPFRSELEQSVQAKHHKTKTTTPVEILAMQVKGVMTYLTEGLQLTEEHLDLMWAVTEKVSTAIQNLPCTQQHLCGAPRLADTSLYVHSCGDYISPR